MNNWIDYAQIKVEVRFKAVFEYYNLQFTIKGREIVCACPLPLHAGDRDNNNAFHVSLEKNCFNCFTHCGGGNIIDFIQHMENLSFDDDGFRKAALFLQEHFLADNSSQNPTDEEKPDKKKQEAPLVNKPLTFSLENRLKYDHPWMIQEKGFSLELVKKFGIGWCKTGLMAGRIVYPVHNTKGELVAYIGRALTQKDENQRGKYLVPSQFHKHLELWNFHRIREKKKLLRDFGLIVVEGFNDALRLIDQGFENVVALMGCSMSDEQERMILSVTDKIVLFLDNNEAGNEGTKSIHKRLIHRAFVKVIQYPENSDKIQPEDFTKDELIELFEQNKTGDQDGQ
ncbi:MAG: toprim domain-containing protein [Deferribacteres bacterium]|nr:toprim domain-containing protein [candidate division KSB1 bacterium]MCB9501374.1 toprim domain-containing protein [Deferribacteres bacterium]